MGKQKNQKNEKIFQSFRKKKRINYITTILIFVVAFFAVWYTNNKDYFSNETVRNAIIGAIWLLSIGGLIINYANWRCPACKKRLGGSFNPQTCRKCGVKLQ